MVTLQIGFEPQARKINHTTSTTVRVHGRNDWGMTVLLIFIVKVERVIEMCVREQVG